MLAWHFFNAKIKFIIIIILIVLSATYDFAVRALIEKTKMDNVFLNKD